MKPDQHELEQVFEELSDEELLAQCESGSLTEEAQAIALKEARSRGLTPAAPRPAAEPAEGYYGDFVIVARNLNMMEANVYRMLLEAAGVPTEVGDANFSRAYGSMYSANVKVPQAFVGAAREIFAAFRRGDFVLDDDFDASGG